MSGVAQVGGSSPPRMTPTQTVTPSPLRAARLRKGLTMDKLAVQAGISRATLYWAEVAPHRMSERTVKAVAAVLKVKAEELRP